MHFGLAHSLVITAVVASIWLLMQGGDRLWPMLATVASGLEALRVFDIISISSGKFRIDVILAGVLTVAAVVCWIRSTTKPAITAATAAALVGAVELLMELKMLA